jgi:hypothetical protein
MGVETNAETSYVYNVPQAWDSVWYNIRVLNPRLSQIFTESYSVILHISDFVLNV